MCSYIAIAVDTIASVKKAIITKRNLDHESDHD